MMKVRELRKWLAHLSQDSEVGIDEGGLCLQEVIDELHDWIVNRFGEEA